MKKSLFIIYILTTIFSLSAHPHVFIDIGMEIKDNSAKISWTFDRIESENKIYFFDDDGDGLLNSKESENLYNEGFISVRDYNFFLTLSTGNNQYPVTEITDFKTNIENDGRLTTSFRIELPESNGEHLFITHFDTSYFISFSDPLLENIKVPEGSYSKIFTDKEHPLYYDPNAARTVTLDTSKPQPGWLTAYPKRVIISNKPIVGYDNDSKTLKEKLTELQRGIYAHLSTELVKKGNYLFIFLLSFLYGAIHALGPGHRKIVISSYLLSLKKSSYLKGVEISLASALVHSGSGIILVLVVNKLFIEKLSEKLDFIGYSALLIITLVLLGIKAYNSFKQSRIDLKEEQTGITMILLSSLVPCPGALAIMVFSLSMGIIPLGVITVIFMSLGIGITLSIISVATIKAKSILTSKKQYKIIGSILEWAGLFILLGFAILMLT